MRTAWTVRDSHCVAAIRTGPVEPRRAATLGVAVGGSFGAGRWGPREGGSRDGCETLEVDTIRIGEPVGTHQEQQDSERTLLGSNHVGRVGIPDGPGIGMTTNFNSLQTPPESRKSPQSRQVGRHCSGDILAGDGAKLHTPVTVEEGDG